MILHDDPLQQSAPPRVSVLIVNKDGGPNVEASVRSVLRQTCRRIEILFVDHGSRDGSLARIEALSRTDARLRVVAIPDEGGSSARNFALDQTSGEWISTVDVNDLLHPQRFERLLAAAEGANADMIADNVLVWREDPVRRAELLSTTTGDAVLELADLIRLSRIADDGFPLGIWKPLLRRAKLVERRLRYSTALQIDEQFDLVVRLIASGLRLHVIGEPLIYQFRGETNSSHATRAEMLDASARLRSVIEENGDAAALAALDSRDAAIARASVSDRPVTDESHEGLKSVRSTKARKRATIISRQRIIGSTNGSSAYVLSLASGLRDLGWSVTLLAPTPKTLGRLPFVRLRPEMKAFDDIKIRGCIRIGDTLVRPDAAAFWRAFVGVAGRVARKIGVKSAWTAERPLPHSISLPWETEDLVYIANECPPSDVLMADYLFQTYALPFALQPEAKTFVIMHDLYSKRAEGFGGLAVSDSIAAMSEESETSMLDQADTVVAIQPEEAEWVRARLPGKSVISVPMPARLSRAPQPGETQQILFVGSNTAPNVIALEWWFRDIWPRVLSQNPDCEAVIAGSVINADLPRPARTQFVGIVPDLDPLYARVAVVISPLTVGSGLKIKLIDALGMGKAIVATTKTLEGAPPDVVAAVRVADEANAFAAHVLDLLRDASARNVLANLALEAAQEHYSVRACHAELVASLP